MKTERQQKIEHFHAALKNLDITLLEAKRYEGGCALTLQRNRNHRGGRYSMDLNDSDFTTGKETAALIEEMMEEDCDNEIMNKAAYEYED